MTECTYINPKIDRTGWPVGPWDDEPDKVSWTDDETGLPCLAVRANPYFGNWCGYVAVEPGHPFHGNTWDDDVDVSVHGGLTYAASCREDDPVEGAVCHIPEPGKPGDVWWFGFDCGHYNDLQPGLFVHCPELAALLYSARASAQFHPTYKTLGYVRQECASLARQLKDAADG